MKTIGIIGGMSWESSAVYYRLFNEIARERLGGLHSAPLILWSFDFAEIEALQAAGEWDALTRRMSAAARRLAGAGAELLVIATNTMHRMADAVQAASGVALVHIADAVGEAAQARGIRRPLVLGTRFTMEQDFYVGRLRGRHGLDVRVPDAAGRDTVHRVIYDELCRGIVREPSRQAYRGIIADAVARGADGVVLGCTEVGLLIASADAPVPVLDSTAIHVQAAFEQALASAY